MFKIGDFSRLSQVSVKTLRFYDELGLFRPAHVDAQSGYRFYAADQLPRLNRILALKDLGFTLEQIAPLLAAHLSNDQLKEILFAKKAEILRRLQDEQETLARVEARLHIIGLEETMSQYEVVIKKVEPVRVAAIREILPRYSAIGKNLSEVFDFLAQKGLRPAGPCAAIWHDTEHKDSDVDGSACVQVDPNARITGNERVQILDLPAIETAASLIHAGSYSRLPEAYAALLNWIDANGYTISGSNWELYLESGNGSQTDESCVTEILFPIAKV